MLFASNVRLSIIVSLFFLQVTACGGGGDSSGETIDTRPVVTTGVFVDSPVSNINYKTQTQSGVTLDGEFKYVDGETVVFSIGSVDLPAVQAAPILTPLSFDSGAKDIASSQIATNIVILLLSLDTDGPWDHDEVITIKPVAAQFATTPINFDQPTTDFRNDMTVLGLINDTGSVMPDADRVTNHINYWLEALEQGINGVYQTGAATLVLFDDNTFFYGETGGEPPNGLEAGTYIFNLRDNTITFTVITDMNGDGGIQGEGSGPDFTFPAVIDWTAINLGFKNSITLRLPEGNFTLDSIDDFWLGARYPEYPGYDWTGAWRATDGVNTTFLLLKTDYTFLYAEYGPDQPNGLEAGTYHYTYGECCVDYNDTITFTLTYDDNGPGMGSGIGEIGAPIEIGGVDYASPTFGDGGLAIMGSITIGNDLVLGREF